MPEWWFRKVPAFVDAELVVGVEPRLDGQTQVHRFDLDCAGDDRGHEHCRDAAASRIEVWGTRGTRGTRGSRSSLMADLDQDGDLDIVTNEFGASPMLLVNDLAQRGPVRWLALKLEGRASNRDSLGATVRVRTGKRELTQAHDGLSVPGTP